VTGLYALEVGSALSYVMAVLVPALDALVPVLPSETVVIALGVATAGSADPRIGLLVALAAFGAFLGDNAAYLVGRRFGSAVDRRLFAGERGGVPGPSGRWTGSAPESSSPAGSSRADALRSPSPAA
jgi:membrane protein YqaA with SNARE-associated domain